jgi:hypothetical protein
MLEAEMIRHQFHAQVKLGKFRDFYATYEKFERVVRDKNLAAPRLWAKSFGNINCVVIIREHESLAAYETDNRSFLLDSDVMNLWRDLSQLAAETPWDELWETASQIA